MYKIGLFTLNGYYNYGNRLQNYALEKILEELGFEVTTIRVKRGNSNTSKIDKLKKLVKIKTVVLKLKYYLNRSTYDYKKQLFKGFSEKYLSESKRILRCSEELKEISSNFDYFVIGSDQVWNPNNLYGTSYYFSPFATKDQNVAYAPSFGLERLPKEWKEKYKEWLLNFNHLSVREEAGRQIVKDLLDIEIPVLVDPTLLLSKTQWLKISRKNEWKPEKKYLLTYFLGQEKKNNLDFIIEFAKQHNLKIVHLGDIKDKRRFTTSPGEFIDYYNDAEIVFTDSFHGTVFSILFKKPFVAFKRGNINSRIDTLLSKFNFEERHWSHISLNKNYFDIDYFHVDSILKQEREKSLIYLKKALGLKKEN
ncbi:MAG: polysaccharide pyruvyl transferase family protein [Halanaerobiales bacterium]|nr:polysaccharide pyruvyl transferase family protein [Halanaerobiales bacterium]